VISIEGNKTTAPPSSSRSAIHYEEQEADELVFLDITSSAEGRKTMVDAARSLFWCRF
jgi:imidazole glycerol phosphate synthase subunit HisF